MYHIDIDCTDIQLHDSTPSHHLTHMSYNYIRPGEQNIIPGEYDEHIETVPRVIEVRLLSDQSHRGHLDAHLDREEDEDEMVEGLEDAASGGDAVLIDRTRPVHAESQAVEQNNEHADSLEPRDNRIKELLGINYSLH